MNYYYKLDEKRQWIQITKEDDKIVKTTICKKLTFDPSNFNPGDIIEVTAIPPVTQENISTRPLQDLIDELKNQPQGDFKPWIYHNSIGNMLEIVWKNEPYFIDYEKDNKHLAYCKSMQTEEIIGIVVENLTDVKLK